MSRTEQEKNKALVLEAFDTLFNKRDYVAAERYWSRHYSTQRSYRNWPRGSVQSYPEHPTNVEVRTGNDRG
jgi:hypothetical protein